MPLVRVEVRNEYGLGAPQLYRESIKEDPKETLEGVAVAGLVGVLRQLGDLSEFAAEVFHGLQEEVMVTSSRSHKLMDRVQRIEAALSPLEKAVLAQKSHLHFAYTAGSNWHTRIRCKKNHFLYRDVPQFIMDSYEDCCDPPHLDLLDKFDPGGPGSCFRRYSDPNFFKRASVASGEVSAKKISKDKKGRRIKKKRSWHRNGEVSRRASFSYDYGRMQSTQLNVGEQPSPTQTASTLKSELDEQSNLDLRNGPSYTEGDVRPSYSVQPEEQESCESIFSPVKRHNNDFLDYSFLKEKITDAYDDIQMNLSQEQPASSSFITWDGKRETIEHAIQESDDEGVKQEVDHIIKPLESFSPNWNLADNAVDFEMVEKMDVQPCDQAVAALESSDVHLGDFESETDHFMDALNTIESEGDTDVDCTKRLELEQYSKLKDNGVHDGVCELMRPNLKCQSSCSESDVLVHSSLTHGSGHLNSICPKSPSETNHPVNGVAMKDDFNSVYLVDKPLQSSQTAEVSVALGNPQSVESHENGSIDAGHNVESVSCTLSSNFRGSGSGTPITAGTGSSLESQKHASDSSSVASVTFWTHGSGHLNSICPKSPSETNRPVNGVAMKDDFNSVNLVDNPLQSSQTAEVSVALGNPQSVESHENGSIDAGHNVESVSCTLSSNFRGSGSGMPITAGTGSSLESQKHASDSSSVASVTFWTNGGLLGLQPSKPPDCSVLNGIPQDPLFKKDGNISLSDHSENFKTIEEGHDTNSSNCCENQESGASFRKPSWKISPAVLDIKLGKVGDSLYSSNANCSGSSAAESGSLLPVNSAFEVARKPQENNRSSSRVFELSSRLLSTGSNKKLLPGGDEKSYSAEYGAFEQKNYQSVAHRTFSGQSRDVTGGTSPMLSPSSSPPLEHMKISFQPVDRFEASKLKLKFPDGNINSRSGSDVFPSFQLVPEASVTRQNVGSNSDVDTFYRSSPSLSDDCHSNQSESNSEQWESSESPTSKDHELYDALRRISLTQSVSTVPVNGRTDRGDIHENCGLQFPSVENGLQNSGSSQMFDLQNSGSTCHSFREELRNVTNPKDLVEPQFESSPAPPLPTVQWRGMMPHLDGMENKCEVMNKSACYEFGHTLSPSTISQPKPTPSNEDHVHTTNKQKSKSSSQKINEQREGNWEKSMDEKGDFLHQIRTKSFSLRPTFAEKPTVPSEVSANVQVNAILEKANAIRQAVGSDDDDGTWSDK